jgi:O-acetyl-ADP-ribose deacetylase (regulator of RNase III)
MALRFVEPQDLLQIDADALVNTVNCEGYMGKGIAKAFAKDRRFNPKKKLGAPKVGLEADYVERCAAGTVKPGKPYVWERSTIIENVGLFPIDSAVPRFVINLPTKEYFRYPSEIAWVDEGLRRLPELIAQHSITSLAMPAPGCGNGGLAWSAVKQLIEKHLGDLTIEVIVVEPELISYSLIDH